MQYSPIALFVYNRLWHTQQTLEALKKNTLAKESELFIFSDAPKDKGAEDGVKKIREYIKTIEGFNKVTIIEGSKNLGLSKAIISGVTHLVARYGKIIVLEDDLIVSPFFLKFMNDALSFYENEEKVISISGYMYPINIKDQETLFLRIPESWGWATWKRAWDLFEPDGKKLLDELRAKKMLRKLNLDSAFDYAKMLRQQIEGKRDSWVIRWTAKAFLHESLSLYPSRSLVRNIGFDNTGTNCGFVNGYETELFQDPVYVNSIPIVEDKATMNAIKDFHRIRKLKSFIRLPSLICRSVIRKDFKKIF